MTTWWTGSPVSRCTVADSTLAPRSCSGAAFPGVFFVLAIFSVGSLAGGLFLGHVPTEVLPPHAVGLRGWFLRG